MTNDQESDFDENALSVTFGIATVTSRSTKILFIHYNRDESYFHLYWRSCGYFDPVCPGKN